MIAQKDNALNVRDTAELKKISKEQNKIALAATQSNASMGFISILTILFLPATFTAVSHLHLLLKEICLTDEQNGQVIASPSPLKLMLINRQTFFSTTFFNFQADRNGIVVSWWLWVYFVVTLLLSAFVLVPLWWYHIWNQHMGFKGSKNFSGDKEET